MRNQSPFYPTVPLPVALEKLQLLFDSHNQSEFSPQDANSCWGYKPDSRTGKKMVKTLESFGLIDNISLERHTLLKISADALAILLGSKMSAHRLNDALKEFSRSPELYRLLWDKWQADLPVEEEISDYLVKDLGYSDKGVKKLVSDYISSIKYASASPMEGAIEESHEDTNLEIDDEDNDDSIGVLVSKERSYSKLKEDTDLDVDNSRNSFDEIPDITLFRGHNNMELEIHEEDVGCGLIDIDFTESLFGPGKETKKTKRDKPKIKPLTEIAAVSVTDNCNVFIMADGKVDRAAFEVLVTQLMLKLENGEFDDESQ